MLTMDCHIYANIYVKKYIMYMYIYVTHICASRMGFSVAYSEFELANVEKLCIQVCRHQSQN